MTNNYSHYGIQNINHCDYSIDNQIEEIYHSGYVIIKNILSSEEIKNYKQRLDIVYTAQVDEVDGEENLSLINDANVVRCPLAYDEIFLKLATHQTLIEICERILGSHFVLLMQNGIINKPNQLHYQTSWHRDLNYQHWISTKPLALSALFCLDPFSFITGGTRILPGSHLKAQFPSEEYIRNHEITVEAPEGSVLIMDAMLFHAAGKNTSDIIRRALNHVIGLPILAQQISIPDMLGGRFKEDSFLEKYLGYRWKPKQCVKQWRLERLKLKNMELKNNDFVKLS